MEWNIKNLVDVLKNGGIAVMPTDTIYGLVGLAEDVVTVNRIYNLKKRKCEKPCIILIGNINQLENFSITLSEKQKNKLKEFWPGPVSIIFDCANGSFSYLHRGTKTLAFRFPAPQDLQNLIIKTGPLIAPSVNPEGSKPAENIQEAKQYFGNSIDFYLDGGKISGKASKVIKLHRDGSMNILRE